jgi:hypothetical protein
LFYVTGTQVSAVLLSVMAEADVTARDYLAEFFCLMHNGDGASSSSMAHGESEGTTPQSFSLPDIHAID